MNKQVKFTLENLHQINNGVLAVAFEREMQRIIADCQDRPSLDKARSVSIVFEVTPLPDQHSPTVNADEITVQVAVHSAIPKRKSNIYTMKTRHDNTAVFHPELNEDHEGDALYDDDVRRRERDGK